MTEEIQEYTIEEIETKEMTDEQAIALGQAVASNHLEIAAELLSYVREAGAKVAPGAYNGVATLPLPSGDGAIVAQFVRDTATAAVFIPASALEGIGESLTNMARVMPLLSRLDNLDDQLSGIEDIEAELTKYEESSVGS